MVYRRRPYTFFPRRYYWLQVQGSCQLRQYKVMWIKVSLILEASLKALHSLQWSPSGVLLTQCHRNQLCDIVPLPWEMKSPRTFKVFFNSEKLAWMLPDHTMINSYCSLTTLASGSFYPHVTCMKLVRIWHISESILCLKRALPIEKVRRSRKTLAPSCSRSEVHTLFNWYEGTRQSCNCSKLLLQYS